MKFSWKLFMWTISIVAITLSLGGYYIINSFFQSSLSRESTQAIDENGIIRFAFETAILNTPSKYEHLQDQTISQIGSNLDTGKESRFIRISSEDFSTLYSSESFNAKNDIIDNLSEKETAYKITNINNNFYIQTAVKVAIIDRELYIETLKDVTNIFNERNNSFHLYRQVCVIVLLFECIVIFIISRWLTRPVNLLSIATRNMAEGDYSYRAKKVSNDELGSLTEDFNKMATSLELHVKELKESALLQQEFVGAFAHELKTPLTAIIGYADMLRSQKLDEETQILSADYIFQEGRRLETLSFKLLDIIVLKHTFQIRSSFYASSIFNYINDTYSNINLIIKFSDCKVNGDMTLIKTLVSNLVDNSHKYSKSESQIEVTGEIYEDKYIFSVKDYGFGVSQENINKITEAFYMVDKSRSRSRNGVGLGLTLCSEIASLHDTKLIIESVEGVGTKISFGLKINLQTKDCDNLE